MQRTEAIVGKSWRDQGLAHLFVMRHHGNGSADVGVFLVDIWCLGVKDAFLDEDAADTDIEAYVAASQPPFETERIHPACAKKLIEGAVAYADRLGIAPHRDYRKARRVLSGLDSALCPTEFSFGRDGRPCFVPGPDDTGERIDRVVALLKARCGENGFRYGTGPARHDAAIQASRQKLIAWLDAEPEHVPRFYRVSGMVTALHLCPHPVTEEALLASLWPPEGRAWADATEAQAFAALFRTYWDYAGELLTAHLAPHPGPQDQAIDVWENDFPGDTAIPFVAAMIEWAGGFMETTELWPDAWGDALQRPDLAEHWEVVRWWSEFVGTGNKDRIADAAESDPPRTIGASVAELARALRPLSPSAG